MIAELGHFALMLALGVALVQAVLPLWGAYAGRTPLVRLAPRAACVQALLLALAYAALTWAFIDNDFSVMNVAQNSHTDKPMLYKVAGVWGNHEGSILLWALVLAAWTAAVARFSVTASEWISAVPTSQGMKEAFSTGSQNHQPPQPSS